MTEFKSIAVSSPRFDRDNLRYITVKSEKLKGRGDISVFVPAGTDHQDLPIVLFLHGVYASHWAWTHLAGVHLHMQDWINKGLIKPMVAVFPSDGLWGDGSGYLPHQNQNFEQWIMGDVIDVVIQSIKETSTQSELFITGMSMGGYGALRLGAKYGNRFKAVSGLSSITDGNLLKNYVGEDLTSLLNENLNELSVLDMMVKNRDNLSKIRFDCGIEDALIDDNRALHQQLLAHDIPHTYQEFDGGHTWDYWEEHLLDTILFFNEQL
ncbi:alpha/beta hydrolase-fold protein [Chitinophagaceae bacterium 26-R-25]|nr:alpha/beta hydrolase-fold protein [Chitinophagaceae bacterium 26-R-25]